MADLLVSRATPASLLITTTDAYSHFRMHRVDRSMWQETPDQAGIYLLWGYVEGQATVYVGMSTTDMRARIKSHHVSPRKNWFGDVFAIPTDASLVQPVEAELIRLVREAGVVSIIDNRAAEERWLDAANPQVAPAVQQITTVLEMLVGDIFTPSEAEVDQAVLETPERTPFLARVYRRDATRPWPRRPTDPQGATHAVERVGLTAWGSFEADEPATEFRVYAGSAWRRATPETAEASRQRQLVVQERQEGLVRDGILDVESMSFARDHVFPNWTQAIQTIAGKAQYSGSYNWRIIED
jgi:hypothetical protein